MLQRLVDAAAVEAEIERVRSLSGAALRRRWQAEFGRPPPRTLGAASDSSSLEGSALAWPTHHRLPDEVVHEVPSDQWPCHRGREGRVFHRQRVSDRSRSAVAIAENRAPWAPPSR